MKKRQKSVMGLYAVLLLSLAVVFSCYPVTQYSVNMRYSPDYVPKAVIDRGAVMKLATFQDLRKTDEPLVIGRVARFDGSRVKVFPKYKPATDAVTEGIRAYLVKSGVSLPAETEKWDLQESTIKREPRGILVGGSIDELNVTCVDDIPTRKYAAKLKLSIAFADLRTGRVFYRTKAESDASMEYILFSEEKMEEQVNSVLAGAIEKIFTSSELKEKLNAAWQEQLDPSSKPAAAAVGPKAKPGDGEEPFVNPEQGPVQEKSDIRSKDIK